MTEDRSAAGADERRAVHRRMIQVVGTLAFIAATLFLSAGTLRWAWAWVYLAASVAVLAANALVLPRELIAERAAQAENIEPWDRVLTRVALAPILAMLVVTGLDRRWAWSGALPTWVHIVGLGLVVAGQGLFTWAMVSNRNFSTVVRLQYERGHAVARGGPYRAVRHPGYVGYIASNLATPLALGSWWGLIPAAGVAALMVVRTAIEDRTLQARLDGYADYARQVRYRLLPGIW